MQEFFTLNLKNFIIDLAVFIVGISLISSYCGVEITAACAAHPYFYWGITLVFISASRLFISMLYQVFGANGKRAEKELKRTIKKIERGEEKTKKIEAKLLEKQKKSIDDAG